MRRPSGFSARTWRTCCSLRPPAALNVLALDPGIRTGCKVAVVDDTGKFLEHAVIYPLEPKNDLVGSATTLRRLIDALQRAGDRDRQWHRVARDGRLRPGFPADRRACEILQCVVNESGASVYSASDIARQEFPDLDLTVRGAISIARRLQDPLAELVKIDPKSIGVGQYQHDVDQKKLMQGLEARSNPA